MKAIENYLKCCDTFSDLPDDQTKLLRLAYLAGQRDAIADQHINPDKFLLSEPAEQIYQLFSEITVTKKQAKQFEAACFFRTLLWKLK